MISKSVWQTHKLADKIAKDILNKRLYYTNNRRQAVIVLLIGSLGTGKTEFTKGLARALHIKAKILSPTFLIMRKYNHFYHLDCYRLLPHPEETLKALAIDEVVNNSKNIVIIEWAENIKWLKQYYTINIYFKTINKHSTWRDIKVKYNKPQNI